MHVYQGLKLIKKDDSVLGAVLEPLDQIINRRMLHQLMKMKNNIDHPLHKIVFKKKKGCVVSMRLLYLRCNMERYRSLFLPAAIAIHIVSLKWLFRKNIIILQYFFHFIFILPHIFRKKPVVFPWGNLRNCVQYVHEYVFTLHSILWI